MKKNLPMLALFMGISGELVRSAVYVDTTITASNGKHKMIIAVPENYSSSRFYSLVLALQPCNGTSYKTYLQALASITDSLHFIVACRDNSGNSVADGNIDIIKASIDSVMVMYNIDNEQVYLTGMSCNGEVALRQGLKKVYPFKGIFPHAKLLPE